MKCPRSLRNEYRSPASLSRLNVRFRINLVLTPIMEGFAAPGLTTREIDVAEGVWDAVHDANGRLRFSAGPDAVALVEAL